MPAITAAKALEVVKGFHGDQAVARTYLPKGQKITETAMFSLPLRQIFTNGNGVREFEVSEEELLRYLEKEENSQFREALKSYPKDNAGDGDDFVARWKNNSIRLMGEHGDEGMESFFKLCCKIDHSCRANCTLVINPDKHCITVHVRKPLKKGQPLTFNYLFFEDASDDYKLFQAKSFEERRADIESRFAFYCTCARCLDEALDAMDD